MTLSLEEITTSFQDACSMESQSMFVQGEILAKAVRDGLTTKAVFKACGDVSGKSYRTICNRYKVEKVFPANKRAAHIDWSLHMLCTTGVDLDKPETYASAYEWLKVAEGGRKTAKGWRPHSFASLRTQIIASGGKPEADEVKYILDNVEASIQRIVKMHLSDDYELVINLPKAAIEHIRADWVWNEAPVFVTITQSEKVLATEATP